MVARGGLVSAVDHRREPERLWHPTKGHTSPQAGSLFPRQGILSGGEVSLADAVWGDRYALLANLLEKDRLPAPNLPAPGKNDPQDTQNKQETPDHHAPLYRARVKYRRWSISLVFCIRST
jgi:hypothetical protein